MVTVTIETPISQLRTPSGTTELGPGPVQMRSTVDLVVEEIRRSVVSGAVAPGSRVSIVELSERLGVSHIPVREALRRLEGDGLVHMDRGRGAVVSPLTPDDLDDVFTHLILLEGDVIAKSAPRFSEEEIAVLRQAWAALEVTPDTRVGELSVRHAEFHQLLVAPAATPWAWRLLAMTWLAAARYMFSSVRAALDAGPTRFRDTHIPLLEAVSDGSARAARRASKEHLEADRDQARARLLAANLG